MNNKGYHYWIYFATGILAIPDITHDVDMDIVTQLLAIFRSATFLNTPLWRINVDATVNPPINPRSVQSTNDAISL